jgi:hypothetical protein
MIWLKQILGLDRYFIVVYMYQLEDGVTGQGQALVTVGGGAYLSTNDLKEHLEPTLDGKIKTYVLLNVIELNKTDYKFYKSNSEEMK